MTLLHTDALICHDIMTPTPQKELIVEFDELSQRMSPF